MVLLGDYGLVGAIDELSDEAVVGVHALGCGDLHGPSPDLLGAQSLDVIESLGGAY